MFNYHDRIFVSKANSGTGEVNSETRFHYFQDGPVVRAFYRGGAILEGQLIGLVDERGVIDMRYHHVNSAHELRTGRCISTPERLPDGRLRLHERWTWTDSDGSSGESMVEELAN